MSLTGTLDVFPVEEVLRLLARSRKTGCLRVESAGHQGRVFVAGGSLTFATTTTDEEVRRQIINAGLVAPDDFRKIELSGAALTEVLAPSVNPSDLTDFIREQIVESLFRLRRGGKGQFDFLVDVATRYPTGQAFDPEVAIGESDRRAMEWSDIEAVIPDLDTRYRLSRLLGGEDAVTITSSTWRILAAVESGANTHELGEKLGLSKFRAARELANLVRTGLMEPVSASRTASPPPGGVEPTAAPQDLVMTEPLPAARSGWETDLQPEAPAPVSSWSETESPAPAPTGWEVEPLATDPVDTPAASWEQPEEPTEPEAEIHNTSWFKVVDEPTEQEAPASGGVDPNKGWWMSEDSHEDEGDEQQADKFLESVFNQLNEPAADHPDEGTSETGDDANFGLGLLRRRRMGAAARDITGS